jgi:hypothetical protein
MATILEIYELFTGARPKLFFVIVILNKERAY